MRDRFEVAQMRAFLTDYARWQRNKGRRRFKEVTPRLSPAEALKLISQSGASRSAFRPSLVPSSRNIAPQLRRGRASKT